MYTKKQEQKSQRFGVFHFVTLDLFTACKETELNVSQRKLQAASVCLYEVELMQTVCQNLERNYTFVWAKKLHIMFRYKPQHWLSDETTDIV